MLSHGRRCCQVTDAEEETATLWSGDLWGVKYQRHTEQSAQKFELEVKRSRRDADALPAAGAATFQSRLFPNAGAREIAGCVIPFVLRAQVAGSRLALKQSPSALLQPGITGACGDGRPSSLLECSATHPPLRARPRSGTVVWDGAVDAALCLEHWVDGGVMRLRGARVVRGVPPQR